MIQSLIIYFQFFTRIPINVPVAEPMERMRSGAKYFSFFGFLLGVIEGVFFAAVQWLFGPLIAFVLTLFFDVLLTGGFHLDALSDMADGLFSSRKKERMLEIMKDSRVGSNGVLALIFYYLMLTLTFSQLIAFTDDWLRILIVVAFSLVGKNGIALLFYKMRYAGATPNGLGASFLNIKTGNILLAQIFTLIILVWWFHWVGLIAYGCCTIFAWIYRAFVLKKVDGLNGDTLGSTSPLSQVIFLLALFACRGLL